MSSISLILLLYEVSIIGGESLEILGCSFRHNTAVFGAGALAVGSTSRTDVIRCNFENNAVRSSFGSGGSIELEFEFTFSESGKGLALVSESNFTNSFAPFAGGAISSTVPGNVTVERSTFTNCVAEIGAACT